MNKVLILNSHPVYYHIPFYQKISKHYKTKVIYTWDVFNNKNPTYWKFESSQNLLKNYDYKFIRNLSFQKLSYNFNFFSCINPSIINEILIYKPNYIILFGYNYFTNILCLVFANLLNIKIIFRGEAYVNKSNPYIKFKFFKKIIFKLVDYVIYSCNSNKKYFIQLGFKEKNLFFGPSTIDENYILSKFDKFNIIQKKKQIVFAGKIDHRKNLDFILNTFDNFSKFNKTNYELIIIGDGILRLKLEQKFSDNKKIKFKGFLDHTSIFKILNNSRYLILGSNYDPTPKIINESIYLKCIPIITDQIGVSDDLIKNGVNGFIFKHNDQKSLTDIFNNLDNYDLLKIYKSIESTLNLWSYDQWLESIKKIIR